MRLTLAYNLMIRSVWRPLRSPLRDWPLILCDARSVAPDDMVEADFIYPGFQGENTFLYFSPNYKLYFIDQQQRDEIWVFKQFDSQESVATSKDPGRVSKIIYHCTFPFVTASQPDGQILIEEIQCAGCPHGSFKNPRAGAGDMPRLSVDITVLVTY